LIKNVIFDFDGTLADSGNLTIRIINELAVQYHFSKIPEDQIRALNNIPMKMRFKQLGIPFYKFPGISKDYLKKYRHEMNSLKTYNGIEDMLLNLKKKNIAISIISSNSTEIINTFLIKNKLDFFDNVLSSNNLFGKHKFIKKYIKQSDLNEDEAIYVADELRDIEACRKVPIKIISVLWGFDSHDLIKSGNPDFIAENPEDIEKIISQIKN
jgi:phosphoglycolate phosphatase